MPNRFNVEKKGGYDIDEVDEYIEKLESVVKSYKDKDSAIKNAILSAQVAADSIIRNAKNRSYEMKENSVKKIQDIVASVAVQKKMLKDFQEEYNRQIAKYVHDVNEKDFAAIAKKIEALEIYLTKYSESDIDDPMPTMPATGSANENNQGGPFGGSDKGVFSPGKDDLLSFDEGKPSSSFDERDGLNSIFNLD